MGTVFSALNPINRKNSNARAAATIVATGVLISQGKKALQIQSLNFPVAATVFAGAAVFYTRRAAIEAIRTWDKWDSNADWSNTAHLKELVAAASIAVLIFASRIFSTINTSDMYFEKAFMVLEAAVLFGML